MQIGRLPGITTGITRRAVRAVAAITIGAAVIASGCAGAPARPAAPGSAPAGPITARSAEAVAAAAARAVVPVAPPGSRAEAGQFGQRFFSVIILPPGSRRLIRDPVPSVLGAGGSIAGVSPSVQMHRFYRVPLTAPAAQAFFLAHLRRSNLSRIYVGSALKWGVTQSLLLMAEAAVVPAGIFSADLLYTIALEPDGQSFIRIDEQVAWSVPRPAAEEFAASDYRSVTLNYQPAGPRGPADSKVVSLTITARPVLGAIVGMVNGMETNSAMCMEVYPEGFWLRLNPGPPGQPAVTISGLDCDDYSVEVGSAAEPDLSAAGGALSRLMERLLKVHPKDAPD
jgi:hypothetical protein